MIALATSYLIGILSFDARLYQTLEPHLETLSNRLV